MNKKEKNLLFVIVFSKPAFGILTELDDIDIRFVHRLDVTHEWVDTEGRGSIDPGHCDTITGLDRVHEIIVCIQYNVVWGLTGRHVI